MIWGMLIALVVLFLIEAALYAHLRGEVDEVCAYAKASFEHLNESDIEIQRLRNEIKRVDKEIESLFALVAAIHKSKRVKVKR